jgi:hypothetical protein
MIGSPTLVHPLLLVIKAKLVSPVQVLLKGNKKSLRSVTIKK